MANRYKLSPFTKPHVIAAADYFGPKHGIKSVGGWRAVGSVKASDHPKGLALDFMTRNKAQGDPLAADLIANYKQWNITYVIWWRRIWSPDKGWRSYSGPSAHTDHVHASFEASGKTPDVTTLPVGGNPLVPDAVEDAAKRIAAVGERLSDVAETVTDPRTWRKVGLYMIGIGAIGTGLVMLVAKGATSVPVGPAKLVKGVGKIAKVAK